METGKTGGHPDQEHPHQYAGGCRTGHHRAGHLPEGRQAHAGGRRQYPPVFFNDTATTEIYTLSLHDALPIWVEHVVFGELQLP